MEGEVKIETWIIILGNLDICVLFSFKDRKDSVKRHICSATHNCQSRWMAVNGMINLKLKSWKNKYTPDSSVSYNNDKNPNEFPQWITE